jgi:ABC-type antimicrobial peptide transport system permease subunit
MARRRREVAIRRVFGAEVKDVVRLFLQEHLLLVLISAAFALPVAYWLMGRWLQEFAYRITTGWSTAATAVLVVTVVVLATILRQVLKASHSNPAEVVKYE